MIPTLREVNFGALTFDGGSITLRLVDSVQVKHSLCLVQHILPVPDDEPKRGGRLYFDDALVEIRSLDELALLNFLRSANINASSEPVAPRVKPLFVLGEDIQEYLAAGDRSPAEAIRYLVNTLIAFVDTDEYVCFGVQDLLKTIESQEDIRILLAMEGGSARGVLSRDRTYNVRFIYVHRKEWYGSIEYEPVRDATERQINDFVNMMGLDINRALQLLAKSDPQIVQWLASPMVYMQRAMTGLRLRELVRQLSGLFKEEESNIRGQELLQSVFAGLLAEAWRDEHNKSLQLSPQVHL